MTDHLKVRKSLKTKKPVFKRSDSHKKKRLGEKWRRPRGIQSKVRLQKKGYSRKVKIGWGSPSSVKGLNKDGYKEIYVTNINGLKEITDKKKEGIVISSTVGNKKKIEIIKKAIESGILILNIKKPEEFIKRIEKEIAEKKQEKEQKKKEKVKKEKEKEEKAKKKEKESKEEKEEKKDDLTEKIAEEEKRTQEKKEKDKLLIKKDQL